MVGPKGGHRTVALPLNTPLVMIGFHSSVLLQTTRHVRCLQLVIITSSFIRRTASRSKASQQSISNKSANLSVSQSEKQNTQNTHKMIFKNNNKKAKTKCLQLQIS